MTHGAIKKKKQGKIVSLAELANIIGSTDPTVRKYIRDGMPQNSKGKSGKGYELDTADCIRWLIEKATSADGGFTNNFDRDRARKMSADADKTEMDRDIMRGELVEVFAAVQILGDRLQTFRSRVLNLPSKAAVKLAAMGTREECLEYLNNELMELLKEMSGGNGA